MGNRVTHSMSIEAATAQVRASFARLFEAQRRVATGKVLARPSDRPGDVSRLLGLKDRATQLARFKLNATTGRTIVDSSAASLQDISGRIIDAREIIIQGLNGTLSTSDRTTLADSLDGILDDLVALANSRFGDRFLFSGSATDTAPFSIEADASGQERVVYRGNDERIRIEIGPETVSPTNVPGSEIFAAGTRGATVFKGNTGAAPGSGTDSGTGVDRLEVLHVATTYGGGGLAPGASSSSDNIIGNHSIALTVDPTGTTGTVSLNGGPPVAFNNPQTDLIVTGPAGERISLDMTGVTPSFSGSLSVTGQGALTLDGGLSSTPITFSANQQVRDSVDGAVLNVDTTAIRLAGVETVTYQGTLDVFSSLIAIRDAFRTLGADGDAAGDIARIQGYLDEFDRAHDQVLESLGSLGTLASRFDLDASRITDLEIRVTELISDIEDVDISRAVVDLQQSETAYQSALLVTSRVNQLSLLNFV